MVSALSGGGQPRPLHVLALMDTTSVSGPLRQLVANLDDLGRDHAVSSHVVICTRFGSDITAVKAFLAAHGISMTHVEDRGRFDWSLLGTYRRILRTSGADVVQTHGYKPNILAGLLRIGRCWSAPWIAFFHGRTSESRFVRVFDRAAIMIMHWADRIVVVSDRHRSYFRLWTSRVLHLPNAVLDSSGASTHAVPDAMAGHPVLFVGRLSPEKGVDVLLAALHHAAKDGTSISADIVGDGPLRKALESQAESLGLRDLVTFHGHQSDVTAFYRRATVLCLPSRSEGMPNVVLEAIALGLPIVATPVGDVAKLVPSAIGRLVTPDDPVALACALTETLREGPSPGYHQARAMLLAEYSRTTRAENMRRAYDALTGRLLNGDSAKSSGPSGFTSSDPRPV
jgi:glycosyltransferase involved in cell wall biosynthesis